MENQNQEQSLKNIVIYILLFIIVLLVIYIFTKTSKTNVKKQENKKMPQIKLVNYNASWCGWSVRLQPVWKQLSAHFKNNPNVEIIDFKCDLNEENDQVCRKKKNTRISRNCIRET